LNKHIIVIRWCNVNTNYDLVLLFSILVELTIDVAYPCRVEDEFADCLKRNLAELRNSNDSVLRLLAENFDFYQLKSRMSKVCNELPGKWGRKTNDYN
jgi:hypothetical protein